MRDRSKRAELLAPALDVLEPLRARRRRCTTRSAARGDPVPRPKNSASLTAMFGFSRTQPSLISRKKSSIDGCCAEGMAMARAQQITASVIASLSPELYAAALSIAVESLRCSGGPPPNTLGEIRHKRHMRLSFARFRAFRRHHHRKALSVRGDVEVWSQAQVRQRLQ